MAIRVLFICRHRRVPNPRPSGKMRDVANSAKEPSMANLLEQLRSMTTVVSDTGDINSIKEFKPTDSTTNPSLIATAATMPAYAQIVDDVLMQAREDAGPSASDKDVAARAFKSLAVAFGLKILEIIPGRVST